MGDEYENTAIDTSANDTQIAHPYVEKGKKLEDVSSTAYSFLLIAIVELVAIILIWSGILPFHMAFYMRCIVTAVISFMSLLFLGIGIIYFRQIKLLQKEVQSEQDLSAQIIQWMQENYKAETFSTANEAEGLSMEQLYFVRSEKISTIIGYQFFGLEESFLEYIVEKIYQLYFPET
ncbi:hypothetical protein LQZ18_08645 [Lachnospiraceae bacterium ZAX-1]